MFSENFFCCYTLNCLYNFCGTESRDQKMNVIFVCAYFDERKFVFVRYLKTYLFSAIIYCFRKYDAPILCKAHKMIYDYRYIITFMNICAQLLHFYLLRSRASGNTSHRDLRVSMVIPPSPPPRSKSCDSLQWPYFMDFSKMRYQHERLVEYMRNGFICWPTVSCKSLSLITP